MEIVAYKELPEHAFIHVVAIDGSTAKFSDESRQVGRLIITDKFMDDTFEPPLWGFVTADLAPGVYKAADVDVQLYANEGE